MARGRSFQGKFGLPVLRDYRAAAPEEFWDSFPVNNEMSGKSLVSPSRLRGLAMALGVSDPAALEKVCSNLEGGGGDRVCGRIPARISQLKCAIRF